MISVIIPTLNEADNIEPLLGRLLQCRPMPDEILFVDDGSTDGTPDRIRSYTASSPVRLLERDAPAFGLSGAVIAGARAARGDLLVVMDADLSHPPEKISELVTPILAGTADMVIGSRYVAGASTPGWPAWRKVMSRVAAGIAFPLTGVHDSMCGFFAMRKTDLLKFTPAATGFKIAFEAIVHGGKQLRVVEVPIVFRDRARGMSKMSLGVALRFAFRWLAAASRLRFRRRTIASQEEAGPQMPPRSDLEIALPVRPVDRD
ncbi:MAG: dolichol-phosphate mannosyltransferase [Verrucomicrobiota bacterium]|jgi:dolichol-phosphate mannosyltransferase